MFYAEYVSNDQTVSGLVSIPQDSLIFPPTIMYKNNTFRLSRTFQVETPHQEQEFSDYCKRNSLETEVNLK